MVEAEQSHTSKSKKETFLKTNILHMLHGIYCGGAMPYSPKQVTIYTQGRRENPLVEGV